jgi:hypothetical protein
MIEYLHNLESYCKDAEDPVQFSQAFFQVHSRLKNRYEPLQNYEYAVEYMHDDSDIRKAVKSRQIGFSFLNMMESIHRALLIPKYEKMFVSVREENAAWLISKGISKQLDL